MTLKNTRILFLLIMLVGFAGCRSSEKVIVTPTPLPENPIPEMLDEATTDTSQFIQVTINGRVRYSFVKTDTSWSGTVVQFDSNDPAVRKAVKTIQLIPTYGWNDFEEMVEFLSVYTLPDQKDIEKRKPGPITNLSREYKVVVVNNGEKRNYNYFNPEGELSENWQSQNIVTFSTYLINEMKGLQ